MSDTKHSGGAVWVFSSLPLNTCVGPSPFKLFRAQVHALIFQIRIAECPLGNVGDKLSQWGKIYLVCEIYWCRTAADHSLCKSSWRCMKGGHCCTQPACRSHALKGSEIHTLVFPSVLRTGQKKGGGDVDWCIRENTARLCTLQQNFAFSFSCHTFH